MKVPLSDRLKRRILKRRDALLRRVFEAFGDGRYSKVALDNLDDRLAKYLSYDEGYFVEAGGNDGVAQSNTYYLEKVRKWRGVLVEPIPDLHKLCQRNRRRSKVFNNALVARDFTESSVMMQYANLMSCVDGALASEAEQKSQIELGVKWQDLSGTYTVTVPARTLTSVLDEADTPAEFDLLSLDVEGYERFVLDGLDLARYRPKFILVESRFYAAEVHSMLSGLYELVERPSPHDSLYRRRAG